MSDEHHTGYVEPPYTEIEADFPDDHEELLNLFGGDDSGHYHLTEEEYVKLQELIQLKREEAEDTEIRYTLSEDEYDKLQTILETVYPDENSEPVFVDEDTINDLADERIQASIDDGTFDDLIDERIHLSEDTLADFIDARIQQHLINELIDARIQKYLSKHEGDN